MKVGIIFDMKKTPIKNMKNKLEQKLISALIRYM